MATVALNRTALESSNCPRHMVEPRVAAQEVAWQGLFRVGGVAALLAALVFRRNLGVEWMSLRGTGIIGGGPIQPPVTVSDWFALLQQDRWLGLILLNLFDLVNYALVGLVFLALCAALRRVSRSSIVVAAALGILGVAVYFASNQALSMLSLSRQYAAATTEVERATLMAAGQALLAIHGTATYDGTGIYISLFLISLAGLILAAVMLRSETFGKVTAWMGILANAFGLGYYVTLALVPAIVALPISVSAIFLVAWYILLGRRLLQLGKTASDAAD